MKRFLFPLVAIIFIAGLYITLRSETKPVQSDAVPQTLDYGRIVGGCSSSIAPEFWHSGQLAFNAASVLDNFSCASTA
jgi:hypothetical protein